MEPVSFPLFGGLDLVTAPIQMPPGRVIASLNYEPVAAGYKRLTGYERFNGRTAPSDAICYRVSYDDNGTGNAVNQVLAGEAIDETGGGSANIGVAVANAVLVSGSWGTSGATAYVDMYIFGNDLTLTPDNRRMNVGGVNFGYVNGTPVAQTALASQVLAAGKARDQISAVTGSGPVRGVWFYNGQILAIRNNAGATAGVMYKATTAGWSAVSLGRTFTFNSGGTTEILASGTTELRGFTSNAVGIVTSITVTSGTWAGGDAAGSITLLVKTGTFQAENVDLVSPPVSNVLTLTNAGTAYALPAGGNYEFLNHNFYGASDLMQMFGVNGVGEAFVYDSTSSTLAPIDTTMTTDTPDHIAEHNNALFLSFPGGSIQFSAVGEPLQFDPIIGAGEFGLGCDVKALVSATESALAILGDTKIGYLIGHDSSDYVMEILNDKAGAIAKSAQRIGQVTYLDNSGIRTLSTTAAFGNFNFGTISQLIAPYLEDQRHDANDPACSFVSRHKSQYWLLFEDGTGVVGYMGRKNPEFMKVDLGFNPTCACSVEIDGDERIFVGADDGFVYELDKGVSFDGSAIDHYVELPYHPFGAPMIEKRGHKFVIDLDLGGTTTMTVEMRFDNGSATGIAAQTVTMTNGSGRMDEGEIYFDGYFRTVSAKIAGNIATQEPHTLSTVHYYVSPRRLKR